jgi:catalase
MPTQPRATTTDPCIPADSDEHLLTVGPDGPIPLQARDRLANNIVCHLLNRVTEPVLQRAFECWHNVDTDLGNRVEKGVRGRQFFGSADNPDRR